MKKQVLQLVLTVLAGTSLTNCCSSPQRPAAANIIYGSPAGGPIPIYVLATYRDLKAGGLAAGWFRGWSQAEFEFLRLDSSRRICVTGQTPTCRRELPIALVAVPRSYLTGEIPGSLALYHVMSGAGDLIGGAGNLLTGVAWFRGVEVEISGSPLATASAHAEGGKGGSGGSSFSASGSRASSSSNSYQSQGQGQFQSQNQSQTLGGNDKKGGHHGGGFDKKKW